MQAEAGNGEEGEFNGKYFPLNGLIVYDQKSRKFVPGRCGVER
jgi:hypothetical protein